MPSALIGFVCGVGVAVFAALFKTIADRFMERRRHIEAVTFEVYMKLMELDGLYFYVAVADENKEQLDDELKAKIRGLTWQIADSLRKEDRVPMLDEIMTLLFSEAAYGTSIDRHNAMEALEQKLGGRVNPRYANLAKVISAQNLMAVRGRRFRDRRAPGLLWPPWSGSRKQSKSSAPED